MPAVARLPSGSFVDVLCGQPEQRVRLADELDLRLREHSDDDRARFYLGVSLVLLRRPAEAEPYLRRIAEGEGAEAPEASWYLALALIDGGDGERATPLLDRIAAGERARRQAASRVLEALGRRRRP